MSLTVYANAVDYGNWARAPIPDNIDQLLRSASIRVALACFRDPYGDTPTGDAVDPLRDATLAQVSSWQALGVDPNAGGLDTRVKVESKIATGSVKYDAISAKDVQAAINDLAPEAREILTAAGLIFEPAPMGADPCDGLLDYGLSAQSRTAPWYVNL